MSRAPRANRRGLPRQASSPKTAPDTAMPVDAAAPVRSPRRSPRRADGAAAASTAGDVAGVDTAAATQSGSDTRKRGWFWHWNSIVTQFAPLIGLKGVGLLNSYTVWTDRREDSPNRGYAFPSQQSEAAFYGEDRAELITINKILVELDLIEIRKEMIVKPDAQGRQWRVPHNFYRVKDHHDGYVLSADSVLRVVHLADRDRNVYRYLRRIFSSRFRPIDADSIWNQIMPELRRDPVWQRLAAKVEGEEQRASDRTRAGHAARQQTARSAALFSLPTSGDIETANDTDNDSIADTTVETHSGRSTSVAATNIGLEESPTPDVAGSNRGSGTDVAVANNGLARIDPSTVGAANRGAATVVAPTNTIYDQDFSTTKTTTARTRTITNRSPKRRPGARGTAATRREIPGTAHTGVSGVISQENPPAGGAGPDAATAAMRAFQDANDRVPTPAQRQLLDEIAQRFDATAREHGATGWGWVAAAIYEAVEAGSGFVAPRRIREILMRWERDGSPDGDDPNGKRRGNRTGRRSAGSRGEAPAAPISPAITRPGAATRPVTAPSARRSVTPGQRPALVTTGTASPEDEPFTVRECGMASTGVWAAMLTELGLTAEIPRADLQGPVRAATLIGRNAGGDLVIGAATSIAERRIAGRYLPALRRAAEAIVGVPIGVEVVHRDTWLAAHPDRGLAGNDVSARGPIRG